MNLESIDWNALDRMRAAFLSGTAGATDYWLNESDLAAYDATFAQRIGWKWDYVLKELKQRDWFPPPGDVLDWGCGSGVASRAFLDLFGTENVSALRVWDRSTLAMSFAARRAREKYSGLKVVAEAARTDLDFGVPPAVLIISHVLTELTQEQTEALATAATQAECVIWVEPGTYETSLTLIAIRERLKQKFNIVAPCTHQSRCGILSPENERHWCHHFASPPQEIFMDSNWARFANMLGIDLRDLPLSFLVLDRRAAPTLSANAGRVIGHPRLYKAHASLLGCDAGGVSERKLMKRSHPEEYRAAKKGLCPVLCEWNCQQGDVVKIKPSCASDHSEAVKEISRGLSDSASDTPG